MRRGTYQIWPLLSSRPQPLAVGTLTLHAGRTAGHAMLLPRRTSALHAGGLIHPLIPAMDREPVGRFISHRSRPLCLAALIRRLTRAVPLAGDSAERRQMQSCWPPTAGILAGRRESPVLPPVRSIAPVASRQRSQAGMPLISALHVMDPVPARSLACDEYGRTHGQTRLRDDGRMGHHLARGSSTYMRPPLVSMDACELGPCRSLWVRRQRHPPCAGTDPRASVYTECKGWCRFKEAWVSAGAAPSLNTVHDKLNRMHNVFHDWDQRVLKKPKKRLRKAQKELEQIMTGPINEESEELSELIEYLLELDEIYYMQRSRAGWLKNGDRNTRFFQAYASARRKRNLIKKLKDGDGNVIEGTTALNPHVQSYFDNLFTSEVQHVDPSITNKVQTKVTEQMNDMLLAPYTHEDVRKAIFSIGDLKAPGPDGLLPFYSKRFGLYWVMRFLKRLCLQFIQSKFQQNGMRRP